MSSSFDKKVIIPHQEYQELLRKSRELENVMCSNSDTSQINKPPGICETGTEQQTRDLSDGTSMQTVSMNKADVTSPWKSQWTAI